MSASWGIIIRDALSWRCSVCKQQPCKWMKLNFQLEMHNTTTELIVVMGKHYMYSHIALLTKYVTQCQFINNTSSKGSGGAILLYDSLIGSKQCYIISHYPKPIWNASINIIYSTFKHNFANHHAGVFT